MVYRALQALFILGVFSVPSAGDGRESRVDWQTELKRPEAQKTLNEYIVSHCMITGPLDDKEWQADHGRPRKIAAIVCSAD
jgi:hypothetical protein